MRRKRKITVLLLMCLALCNLNVGVVHAAGQNTKASTIKVEGVEGTAAVINAKNKEVSVTEGMQLYSGDKIKTDAQSYAYISLDESKLVKVDELSEVLVEKSGKKLKLTVAEGALFFVVSEKLKEDESMTIGTTTMSLSIRGTSGVVRGRKTADGYEDVIWLLDGRAEVTMLQGDKESFSLWGGEQLTFREKENTLDRKLIEMKEIPGFAAMEIGENETLTGKIEEQSGLDVEWIHNNAETKLKSDQTINLKLWQQNQEATAATIPVQPVKTVDKQNDSKEVVPDEEEPTEPVDSTEDSESTEEPTPTETPAPTEEPISTEAPASTESPVSTEEPTPTEEPAATETPVPTEVPNPTEEPSEGGTYTGKVLNYIVEGDSCMIEFEANTGTVFEITRGSGFSLIRDLNKNSLLNDFEVTVEISYITLDGVEYCKGNFVRAVQTEESRTQPLEIESSIYVTGVVFEAGDCNIRSYLYGSDGAQLILGDVSLLRGSEEGEGANTAIECSDSVLQVGNVYSENGYLNMRYGGTMIISGSITCDSLMYILIDETTTINGLETIVNSGWYFDICSDNQTVTALKDTDIINTGTMSIDAGVVIKSLENQEKGKFRVSGEGAVTFREKLVITETQAEWNPVYYVYDELCEHPVTGMIGDETKVTAGEKCLILTQVAAETGMTKGVLYAAKLFFLNPWFVQFMTFTL